MKRSIRFKMTFLLTSMVVLAIFITWFINRTFLSDFYFTKKMNALDEAYQNIVTIYQQSSSKGYLSDEETEAMEKLEQKYGIEISVVNNYMETIYPEPVNLGQRQTRFIDMRIAEYIFPGFNKSIENKKIEKKSDNYVIYSLYDRMTDSNYMDLVAEFYNPNNCEVTSITDTGNGGTMAGNESEGSTGSDSTQDSTPNNAQADNPPAFPDNGLQPDQTEQVNTAMVIRTNVESIEDSAAIANEFLAYIGIAVVLLGSAAMFLYSRRFTKPILELADISKKMSELDFDIKYHHDSKDEIGILGSSINTLSDKLESTITELKQANNELLTDIQKKTEIDEMRKEFLSNVSHELKTPISLIQGYAEGLKENISDDPESRDFYCEVIMDEASKMNQMVKKLLSLNELEFGNNQVNFERFDIVTLIRSVLSSTEILFRQKGVTLRFAQSDPVYVWADEYLIEQVVTNYISNALNHVEGQRIIEIKLIQLENRVRVAVLNTGDNIPEEDIDKIWVKFYKVDKARTREYGGSGIGLSIVRAVMNLHNRECGVLNRPLGVEFWFELDTKTD